jgi:nitrogenase molybdenum-cofactor synthesis protein NifE
MAVPSAKDLINEPSCKHKQKDKSACKKAPEPGSSSGGCAFDGATITLLPIADAAHLVHGPIGCWGNAWGSRNSLSSGPNLYKRGFTTDLSENDIVLGGEGKLRRAILDIARDHKPKAVFVYLTCVPAATGEDIESACKEASKETGLPVIPVMAPGFLGSKVLGTRVAGDTLLRHVIGTVEPKKTTPFDIALIGEYNVSGELWDILPILNRLGIRVLSRITGDGRFEEVAQAHRARLSVLICSNALINLAGGLKERYGIPFVEGSFFGLKETNTLLLKIAQGLGDPGLIKRTQDLTKAMTERTLKTLEPVKKRLLGKKAVLYTGGVKSWSVISALKDLGMEVIATSTRKSTDQDIAKAKELLSDRGVLLTRASAEELLELVRTRGADMLIAGGRNQYTALKGGVAFLDSNQERARGYAGYRGLIRLGLDLQRALDNPVWNLVKSPAPWELAKEPAIASGAC